MEDLREEPALKHNLDRRMRVYLAPEGPGGGRVRLLALRPGVGHRLLHAGLSPLRTGLEHHPHIQQGLRRVGRAPGGQCHRLGRAGPAAPSQPCPQHPRGELPAQGEKAGGAVPVTTTSDRFPGASRRQLCRLTETQDISKVAQFQPVTNDANLTRH